MGKQLNRPDRGTVFGAAGLALGVIALIVALVGPATATTKQAIVRKGDIAPGAVTAANLAKGAVKAKAIAKGAVTSKALADGAVNKRVLAKAAVIASALADNAVTSRALAPGSVYGGALNEQTIHVTPIKDLDEVAENGTWTASNSEVASCSAGERLLSAGFVFNNPGNREVSFLQAQPFVSPQNNGVAGRIASNSGGSAEGQIFAFCLK